MVKRFPSDINRAAGLVEALSGIGLVTGPALGSALYAIGGFPTPFYFCGGVFLLSCFFVFKLIPASVETVDSEYTGPAKVTYWNLIKNRRIITSAVASGINIF